MVSFAKFLENEGDPINIGSTYVGSPSIFDYRYSLKIYQDSVKQIQNLIK